MSYSSVSPSTSPKTNGYPNPFLPWLRWWGDRGNLLPTAAERATQESQRADRAEQGNERLRARLQALGIEVDAI